MIEVETMAWGDFAIMMGLASMMGGVLLMVWKAPE